MKFEQYLNESNAELYKLYTQAMQVMPNSKKQKEIKKKINKLRKEMGMNK